MSGNLGIPFPIGMVPPPGTSAMAPPMNAMALPMARPPLMAMAPPMTMAPPMAPPVSTGLPPSRGIVKAEVGNAHASTVGPGPETGAAYDYSPASLSPLEQRICQVAAHDQDIKWVLQSIEQLPDPADCSKKAQGKLASRSFQQGTNLDFDEPIEHGSMS